MNTHNFLKLWEIYSRFLEWKIYTYTESVLFLMASAMKQAVLRRQWKRALSPPLLRGWLVVRRIASTGKLNSAMGRAVRKSLWVGQHVNGKGDQAGQDHSQCQVVVYSNGESARVHYQSYSWVSRRAVWHHHSVPELEQVPSFIHMYIYK